MTGDSMRKKRDPETADGRSERLDQKARDRAQQVAEEERAIDAAIRRSIDNHGA